jgi:hypothetical protein
MKTLIIVGRERSGLTRCLETGDHAVGVLPGLLNSMIIHQYTKETVQH